jgi:hypothetical protein
MRYLTFEKIKSVRYLTFEEIKNISNAVRNDTTPEYDYYLPAI